MTEGVYKGFAPKKTQHIKKQLSSLSSREFESERERERERERVRE